MVILQFNKLIRNKWVWGVFAIIVSAAFCLDDFFRSSDSNDGPENPLEDLSVAYDGVLEAECRDALRVGAASNDNSDYTDDLRRAYAAAAAFDQAGVWISDNELGQMLNARFFGNFESKAGYKAGIQRTYAMDVARFERAWRRNLQIDRGYGLYRAASTWVSPMEIDQIRHDKSDVFSVRTVTFDRKALAAGPEKIEEADVKAWYDANVARVKVPKTYSVRYVAFESSNTNLMAKCTATDEEIKKYYDDDPRKIYSTTNATGEKVVVKELKDVRDDIAKTLANNKFVATYDKLLRSEVARVNNDFADSTDENKWKTPSLVNKFAGLYGLKAQTAENVAVAPEANLVDGLVVAASKVFSSRARVASLRNIAPSADNFRYVILKDEILRKVWVAEVVAENDAKQVAFADCKDKIEGLALKDKQDESFEAAVKKIVAEGVDAVLKAGKAEEAKTYSAATSRDPVLDTVSQLNKGEMSDLIGDKVYVCVDRTAGDYEALATADRGAVASVLAERSLGGQKKWMAANLVRLGYEEKASNQD